MPGCPHGQAREPPRFEDRPIRCREQSVPLPLPSPGSGCCLWPGPVWRGPGFTLPGPQGGVCEACLSAGESHPLNLSPAAWGQSSESPAHTKGRRGRRPSLASLASLLARRHPVCTHRPPGREGRAVGESTRGGSGGEGNAGRDMRRGVRERQRAPWSRGPTFPGAWLCPQHPPCSSTGDPLPTWRRVPAWLPPPPATCSLPRAQLP